MRPRWLLCLALVWLSCAPAPVAPAPADAEPAATTPAGTPATASSGAWEQVDPRAVRCGIDDRPRSVTGQAPPPWLGSGASPVVRVKLEAPEEFTPPPSRWQVERYPLEIEGATASALATELGGIDPQYGACDSLLQGPRLPKPMMFLLDLAPSGASLRVTPLAEGGLGPYAQCLMERVCQLRSASALGHGVKVKVGLGFAYNFASGSMLPEGIVSTTLEGGQGEGDKLQQHLQAITTLAGRRCGFASAGGRLRLLVELKARGASSRAKAPSEGTASRVDFVAVEGRNPPSLEGCMRDILTSVLYPWSGASTLRSERLIVTSDP